VGKKLKFNLKNRPVLACPIEMEEELIEKLDEWFEGFEKELRELYGKYGNQEWLNRESAFNVIKEILGE